jgi:3-oxosteroid 1-dehydrogenase
MEGSLVMTQDADRHIKTFDEHADVVIVGSGFAGLVAALTAKELGFEPLVLEKSAKIGGSSAYSGGGAWIPNNPLQASANVEDSYEEALTYLEEVIGDAGPATSLARKHAFLQEGPRMVEFLQQLGMRFRLTAGYPDYYPERPGGSTGGRAIEGETFNGRELGTYLHKLAKHPTLPSLPMSAQEVNRFPIAGRSLPAMMTVMKVIFGRYLGRRLIGQVPLGLGQSLMGQMLKLALDRDVEIRTNYDFRELVLEHGRVVGVVADHNGSVVRIGSRRATLLCAGGFARNAGMRERYGPNPITDKWTSAPLNDRGDAVRAGMAIGAATALLEDAWWIPSCVGRDGNVFFLLWERSLPHSIIVDSTGERFMNESAPYVDCGHLQYERNAQVPAIPAWLIMDARHRGRYPFGPLLPGITPKSAYTSGLLTKAPTLRELASKIGVDSAGLARTVERFNGFARSGTDEDFARGKSVYDHHYGDPRNKPNTNLGALEKAPFYAAAIYPGDIGTKGGLLTDEYARVVRDNGSPIEGLYAAGNTSATMMGHTYPGPGSTIGPTGTFAYIAMRHALGGIALDRPVSARGAKDSASDS